MMETRGLNQLRPHPENDKIYGDHADNELIESVQTKGILNPLLITHDGTIINGHRRYEAAKRVGMLMVPIVVFQSDDELDILEALIESNRQRQKTNEQIGRESDALLKIEIERNKRNRSSDHVHDQKSEPIAGKSYKVVGEKLGVSHNMVHQAVSVVRAIDDLRDSGKEREADQLRTTLNRSVQKAYETSKEAGYIAPAPRPIKVEEVPKTKSKALYSIAEWQILSEIQRSTIIECASGNAKFNEQETNNIEWALWSWNPVTGCKHNCPYCYARDIAERFYEQKFEPSFLPDRLTAPFNTRVPNEAAYNIGYKNVFTCSMADLFGRWVPTDWIQAVLDTVARAPQWNFLFLTKFPIRMAEFEFPDNAWVGTSVDCQARVKNAEDAFRKVNAKVKWLSCEPLLEPLQFSSLEMFSWIVLGGASKSTQTPEWRPPRQWINDIEQKAHEVGCMIYEKTNLLERVKEYPGGDVMVRELPESLRYLAVAEKR